METQPIKRSEIPTSQHPACLLLAEEDGKTVVTAALSGHSGAFEILVKLLRSALRLTLNRADAEDVVQQSLEKASVHLGQFRGHSSFSTWLTRIAMNEALMCLRKKRAVLEVPIVERGDDVFL